MKLLIISGLSGAGKSHVLQALEDLDFYCIDNLPLALLPHLAVQMKQACQCDEQNEQSPRGSASACGVAVGIDARNLTNDLQRFQEILNTLRESGFTCEIIFVEANANTLLKRFSETRRKHPLTRSDVALVEALSAERQLLRTISRHADLHIDTSHLNVHQLRTLVRERIAKKEKPSLSLLFLSFGFKCGIPADVDFIFDVRCLPNPHWEPALRPLTGRDAAVVEFLAKQSLVGDMQQSINSFLQQWIPRFEEENRSYLTVAIGCTGGQHRSVYLAEALTDAFQQSRENVLVRHRELP
ncbi:MAG: RNase adapter RapZ [Gammaproteobacteria bacterium]|nr:RNase adapter RapZ [Gammaproteobacteria bacterium]